PGAGAATPGTAGSSRCTLTPPCCPPPSRASAPTWGPGLVKGIGPVMAERMVAHFGTDILAIIEQQPGRLIEVHGLGPKRTKKIAEAWEEQKAIKEVMVFLSGVGVSTSLAVRIYKKYGSASITIVKNEPY